MNELNSWIDSFYEEMSCEVLFRPLYSSCFSSRREIHEFGQLKIKIIFYLQILIILSNQPKFKIKDNFKYFNIQ